MSREGREGCEGKLNLILENLRRLRVLRATLGRTFNFQPATGNR
jgi:hypothetical protein